LRKLVQKLVQTFLFKRNNTPKIARNNFYDQLMPQVPKSQQRENLGHCGKDEEKWNRRRKHNAT
jgi:hypothetical protein